VPRAIVLSRFELRRILIIVYPSDILTLPNCGVTRADSGQFNGCVDLALQVNAVEKTVSGIASDRRPPRPGITALPKPFLVIPPPGLGTVRGSLRISIQFTSEFSVFL
jgi:hypothetical protein